MNAVEVFKTLPIPDLPRHWRDFEAIQEARAENLWPLSLSAQRGEILRHVFIGKHPVRFENVFAAGEVWTER